MWKNFIHFSWSIRIKIIGKESVKRVNSSHFINITKQKLLTIRNKSDDLIKFNASILIRLLHQEEFIICAKKYMNPHNNHVLAGRMVGKK